ncbi:hypothetical protein S83_042515 [Arachis hypogaea]
MCFKGRLIEDIAKVVIPTYKPNKKGLPCTYASISIQPNSFDCGVYAIKFMEYWIDSGNLNDWNYDTIK